MVQKGDSNAIQNFKEASKREREPSMYGDEETGTPPDELYYKDDATEALEWASYVLSAVEKLLLEVKK
ncbi:MAG: hypothetical protein QW219_03030 [Fervidicoccaceae archaeon]